MKVVNRQAAEERNLKFEGLAAFANMGDTPEEWRSFRLKHPQFFPDSPFYESLSSTPITITEWLHQTAENWFSASMLARVEIPALLWYRNHLRAAWSGLDRTGSSLCVLYGFEKGLSFDSRPVLFGLERRQTVEDQFYLGQPPTSVLPQGEPFVDGASRQITWKFGCEFQQSVFELMKDNATGEQESAVSVGGISSQIRKHRLFALQSVPGTQGEHVHLTTGAMREAQRESAKGKEGGKMIYKRGKVYWYKFMWNGEMIP